jgi:hypothetical protein
MTERLVSILGLALASFTVAAQTPRNVFDQPDLTGTWDNGAGIDFIRPVRDGASICFAGCDTAPAASQAGGPPPPPDRPSYRPEFQARVAELNGRQVEFDPVLRCMAPGVPRIGPPDKIVQQANEVIFLYDDVSGSFFRIIPTDGREIRTDSEPSYLGDAIGRYEGDALIVETVNFNGLAWLTDDGSFHTPNLRVVERITRDGDTLSWQATAYDSDVLAEPWVLRPRTADRTDKEIVEGAPCIDRDLDHIVDGSHHDNAR